MPDTAVAITAGTGTNIDTRTEATNGNHRQVVVLGDPSTNAGVAPVDATAGLKVDLGADNDISGTVTANAGTNLNTSLLALEAGGNLATIAGKDFATQTTLSAINGKLPSLGQAVASAAVPVVLPTAQITTLTPQTDALTDTQLRASAVPISVATIPSHAVTNAGTFATQAAQSGTWTVQPGNTANTTAWKVDGSAVTQPVSIAGTVTVTGGGGGTEYTEDAAAAANPVGTTLQLIREDARAGSLTTTDGDNVALRGNNKGEAYVKTTDSDALLTTIDADTSTLAGAVAGTEMQVDVLTMPTVTVNSHAVTNAGTFVTQENGALLTSAQLIDDVVYTDDTSTHATGTSKGVGIMATATPTDTSVNANDIGMVAMTTDRRLLVDASGVAVPITDNSGSITVDGTFWQATQPVSIASVPSHAVTNAGTFAVQATEADGANVTLGAKADAKSTATDTTAVTIMSVLKQISASVQAPPSQAVTNAGTFATQATSAGDIAHDSADSGNPVKVGGKAVSAEPTAVTANDRANFITDLVGKLITLPYANPENFVSGAITTAMTGTTSTSLIAAPAAGLRNYITTIICSNAHATVGTDIVIQDGSGGTTLLTIPAAAVYGGAVITLPVPLRQPTTATAIFCANVTTGASTKVSAVGYKGA